MSLDKLLVVLTLALTFLACAADEDDNASKVGDDSGDSPAIEITIESTKVRYFNGSFVQIDFECGFDGCSAMCQLNQQDPVVCEPPYTVGLLSDGDYNLTIAPSGGGASVVVPFVVDTEVPELQFDEAPAAETTSTEARFVMSCIDATECTYLCRFTSPVFLTCASTEIFEDLMVGVHVFEVQVVDQAENASDIIEYTWTVIE